MLGRGDLWPPATQWLDPDCDERLIATALAVLEQQAEERERRRR